MTKAKTAPKNAGTDKESIAAARRAALNETLKASGLTPHALARMAGIDGGNLRAAASGVKGMGEAKWLKVAAASPAGSALRDLFPDTAIAAVGMPAGTPHSGIISVPFNKLVPNPDNYRKTFDKVELENLAESILDHGILQNLVVLPAIDGIHQINSGGRRYAAMQLLHEAGILPADFAVPCLVKDITADDARALAIVENIQRQDVPVLEEAEGFRALSEMGWETAKIANICGLSTRTVQDRLQLIERLTAPAREALANNQITLDQARAIMSVRSEEDQADMVLHAVKHDYTAAALRDKAKRGKPSIAAAEFDVADYKGEFLGEGKHRVFADADAFTKLQRKAAAAIAATLRAETMPDDASHKRYAMVTLVPQGERFEQWRYRDAKPGEDAEAFVWVESWNHKIETATGLIAKPATADDFDDEDDDDAELAATRATETAAREAQQASALAFERTMQAHYAKHPADMLRLTVLTNLIDMDGTDIALPTVPEIYPDFRRPETQDAIRDALGLPDLFKAYDSDGKEATDTYLMLETMQDIADTWDRLLALDLATLATVFAIMSASTMRRPTHAAISDLELMLTDCADIEVPDFLRPAPAETPEAESEAA